ncbi:hypothetical protein M409DRAFT_18223 [Zasmidium cellare ATCC 36951]|uniref:Uncharacterized protein n=1 Tax=Zasmidium cellare ATCC 36951 TaxID=1080233 RepID=A0A6A6D1E6_ZASCE|nr:uncharacterized protein M409DRAFT_18223 [Zasmidium cellare ATCC 36951]KAF2171992.1 hypothetical protein M409DRAFT_18223 [Zasmidium cellare ATCC 36951]
MSCRSLLDVIQAPFTRNRHQSQSAQREAQPLSASRQKDQRQADAEATEQNLKAAKANAVRNAQQGLPANPEPLPGTWSGRLLGSLRGSLGSIWNTLTQANEADTAVSNGNATADNKSSGPGATVATSDGAMEIHTPQIATPSKIRQASRLELYSEDFLRSPQEERRASKVAAQGPSTDGKTSQMQRSVAERGDSCTLEEDTQHEDTKDCDDNADNATSSLSSLMMSGALSGRPSQQHSADEQVSHSDEPQNTNYHDDVVDNTGGSSPMPDVHQEGLNQEKSTEQAPDSDPRQSSNDHDDKTDKRRRSSSMLDVPAEPLNHHNATDESAADQDLPESTGACDDGADNAATSPPTSGALSEVSNGLELIDQLNTASRRSHDSYGKYSLRNPNVCDCDYSYAHTADCPLDSEGARVQTDDERRRTFPGRLGVPDDQDTALASSPSEQNDVDPTEEDEIQQSNNIDDAPGDTGAAQTPSSNVYEQNFQVNMVREIVYDHDPFPRFTEPSPYRSTRSLHDNWAQNGGDTGDLARAT